MKTLILIFSLAFITTHLTAKDAGKTPSEIAEQQALDETIRVLNSPAERKKIIDSDTKAQDADAQVEALVGAGPEKQKVYELSGKIMEKLMKKANGDPGKMLEILEEAKRNPAAFANQFTTEEKKILSEIGASVDKSGRLKQNP